MNGMKGARLLHSHGHRLGRTVDICGPAHKAEAEAVYVSRSQLPRCMRPPCETDCWRLGVSALQIDFDPPG